ncbi:putative 3'-5' exonuclease [Halobacteriovorax marinus SJ]|uniref:3'-5' exonuclease n=1 Tax=Halobacteriovorax marinus (strain ATCC BAA-682 / DSM 15412 / SJ) TaxID=862908 RepID=E1WXM5_HALMS|nr:3'-5' exonuclease [Halobacteriovorax marinus]CBW25831.1 putative 3'-5' exonuclease [Halobacteriovorax marinus SJ]
MSFKKSIEKEEINKLEMLKFQGNIHLITDDAEAIKIAKKLSSEEILGFDTETRPSFKKGENYDVALLQLSTENDAYLFRLNKMKLPNELVDLLADENIVKAGVAVRDDIKSLQKLNPFKEESFCELQDVAKELGVKNFGLRALCAIFLNYRLSKRAKITNWEQPKLTQAQIHYAACDAWVGLQIYKKMQLAKN